MERGLYSWSYWASRWFCLVWTGAPCGERVSRRTSSRWLTGTSRPRECVLTGPTAWWTSTPLGSAGTMAHSLPRARWPWRRTPSRWATSPCPSPTWSLWTGACTPATCTTTTAACTRDASSGSPWHLHLKLHLRPPPPKRPESSRTMCPCQVSHSPSKTKPETPPEVCFSRR